MLIFEFYLLIIKFHKIGHLIIQIVFIYNLNYIIYIKMVFNFFSVYIKTIIGFLIVFNFYI
jgi:hypothetical protein